MHTHKKPNRRQRRNMKQQRKTMRPQIKTTNKSSRPETKEQLLGKIRQLEYQRIQIPKFPDVRTMMYQDAITQSIRVYYAKIDALEAKEK